MSDDHTCRCPHCDPAYFPSGPRQHEGHVALRFGDSHLIAMPYRDGKPFTRALEVCAGRLGWAIAASYPGHLCRQCGRTICQERVTGNWSISSAPERARC